VIGAEIAERMASRRVVSTLEERCNDAP